MQLNSSLIKELALEAGFDSCGISNAKTDRYIVEKFKRWISLGYNAEMNYLKNHLDIRKEPRLLVENARSVISVIENYYTSVNLTDNSISISKYAFGKDYHKVLKKKLNLLLKRMQNIDPDIKGRVFIDTAPVFERYFASKSGLGFIGKNNCLINEKLGSWIFIGEIIVDREFDYDIPLNLGCGTCRICIESCPTGALSENCLDANKCISYHTIENKGDIPVEIGNKMTTQLFGCDICQDVCPFNRNALEHKNNELKLLPQIRDIDEESLISLSEEEFNDRFSGTSLKRAGYRKLLDNFKILSEKL